MQLRMPPANTRKRPAPDTSPVVQHQQMPPQSFPPTQLSNDQFMRWSQSQNGNFTDANAFNANVYGGDQMSQGPYQQNIPAPSTQLARRPMNRSLVATGSRQPYDDGSDAWPFGNDGLDLQNGGAMEENDNIELLEEKAAIAKRDAQSKRKQIPPFVQKLSSFLDESKNTDLIRWSDRGDSFVVLDEDEFAKTLIPELFKHNNYASFVRQLNMYGFHKRVGLSDNSMKASERKNKSPSEYYNMYFKRGHPNLLWLINKPKSGTAGKKGKGVRVKNEDGAEGGSDEEGDGVDEIYGHGYGQGAIQGAQRAISAAPEAGPLQRREMAMVREQLQEIQKQQSTISNAISRLRKDHNQLYQQAVAFQTLHDRHESSINAILTFLATVYNRSLDGQGVPNMAQMFANSIPQQQEARHGGVVDMTDFSNNQQQPTPGSPSPHRAKQQRLLMAPPVLGRQNSRSATVSPGLSASASPMPTFNTTTPKPTPPPPPPPPHTRNHIEELFETSPAETPPVGDHSSPQQQIMSIINNTNASAPRQNGGNDMNFPDVLSHYENANGNAPLTSQQRESMLNQILKTSSSPGTNNALISPTPPPAPSLEALRYTQAELDELARMQQEQDAKLQEVSHIIQPLSPSGSIPGLDNGQYFNDANIDGTNNNLDLDQYLDPGAYYANGEGMPQADGDFNYDTFGDGGMNTADGLPTGFSFDGVNDADMGDSGRVVEAESSGAPTPTAADEKDETPSKRIRTN